ncbi:DinB family protein [Paenibacillus sp. Marseille-Q4541]|uniref:DinB family protein n=1 Tax=Paenibacillus sp. Marseille-Q4541 TaxID=2831522 RepID=UPI001BA8F801|nr:DinB family protein [Paenibacillus sp. Marseille-Q4541]
MDIIKNLENLITAFPEVLKSITEEELCRKANPNKWSKKEILGHLCDSASNNHHRFLKIRIADEIVKLEGYNQDLWVSIHDYQDNYSQAELTTLWFQLNKQIRYVLEKVTDEEYQKQTILADGSTVTLQWLAEDYIHHTIHHIKQITEQSL